MNTEGNALAQGLYWYAEKLLWGHEGVEKDYNEAFKLFRGLQTWGSLTPT